MLEQRRPVPVRTILAAIGLVAGATFVVWLVVRLARIEAILIVAIFFAVVLHPVVEGVQRKLHIRRGLAAALVFFTMLLLLGSMTYAFVAPLVREAGEFSKDFPGYVRDAREGRGPAGDLVKRLDLDEYLEENQDKLENSVSSFGGGAFRILRTAAAGVAAAVTVFVLAILMVIYGPDMLNRGLGMLSPPTRLRVRAVARDCARALTGYVFGNLLISLVAGTVTFLALWIMGVPFKEVLALFVGFMDLIPLVGATIGAVVVVLVAFLHSTPAGIVMIVVFVVYQQFENHVLQVVIMSKTVKVNPLMVLVSALVGVELFGLLGALLAIPAAGVIQVIGRDIYDHRKGGLKPEPTIGADEIPISELPPEDLPDDLTAERGPQDEVEDEDEPAPDEPAPSQTGV